MQTHARAHCLTSGLVLDPSHSRCSRGMTHAIAVDASSAYIEAARHEAERVGRARDIQFVHADFVSAASQLPSATVVTLDRVICCYPSYEPLLSAALGHADRCVALSYPRAVW